MPSPDQEEQKNGTKESENGDDTEIATKQHTASKMLSLFRQMEEQKHTNNTETGPKPLKRFTPPPDDNKRVYSNQDSDEEYTDEEVEEEGRKKIY